MYKVRNFLRSLEGGVFALLCAGLIVAVASCGGGNRVVISSSPSDAIESCGIDAVNEAARSVVRLEVSEGTGSGFLLPNGLIVTDAHVVAGSTSAKVQYADGALDRATVVSVSDALDLALLQPATKSAVAGLAWGDSAQLKGTQNVIAIGFPRSFVGPPVLTKGSVSRLITVRGEQYVQTDAAINGGNSGGPLVDDCGRVVGVVTSKFNDAEGLGFAQAAAAVRPEVEKLTANPHLAVRASATPTRAAGGAAAAKVAAGIFCRTASFSCDGPEPLAAGMQMQAAWIFDAAPKEQLRAEGWWNGAKYVDIPYVPPPYEDDDIWATGMRLGLAKGSGTIEVKVYVGSSYAGSITAQVGDASSAASPSATATATRGAIAAAVATSTAVPPTPRPPTPTSVPATATPVPATATPPRPAYLIVAHAVCRSDPACSKGPEQVHAGDRIFATFDLDRVPVGRVRANVYWNGVLAVGVNFGISDKSGFYFGNATGIAPGPGDLSFEIIVDDLVIGGFSGRVVQ